MTARIAVCLMVTALLLMGGGGVFASDSGQGSFSVAQLTDMRGAGAASDAKTAETSGDYDDFDDFDEYGDAEGQLVADPFKGWNMVWFHFNDAMYHGVFKPVATGYAWAIPAQPRQWVRNFFTNMLFPVRFVNNILQGKFDAAYMETSKFLANTSWGLLGFADVTSGMKRNWTPERPTADGFGQTLGKAGFGHGVYLVWPFLGPSSVRESVGWVGDTLLDPVTYADLTFIEMVAVRAYKNVNQLSLELTGNEYETLTEGAIDKYAAVRDAYIRFRAKKVRE
ncbi:VacJ family lipoprotein [Pseudodesulfovibrio sp. F-1]|uniref:VacJ family lipoprotein n=1 Tax=Pseudodesulfovibrio alkaliphilus TaxID=2661613 RepID=A0A7K1KNM1_9BACT|nr:VacJ family lipoprotein [Pseudodesulfovibrio alkaliphilus]MUM77694.1 VacJ family lipoprotein [Pseudodesulfovibrio alkaliphilus]